MTFASVDADVVDVTTDVRLEDGFGDRYRKQVVLTGLMASNLAVNNAKARSMGALTTPCAELLRLVRSCFSSFWLVGDLLVRAEGFRPELVEVGS